MSTKAKPKAAKKVAKDAEDAPERAREPVPAHSARPKPFDPAEEVIKKYTEFGWTAIRAPVGTMNDVLAKKDRRFHFVQVLTKENADDARFTGLPKNNFIQNAFSNGAVPVFAFVTRCACKNADGTKGVKVKVVFEDVNLNKTVIVGGKKIVAAEPAEKK